MALLVAPPSEAQQGLGNKMLGTLGLRAGSQPESGIYLADRFLLYSADQVVDRNGQRIPVSVDLDAVANAIGIAGTFELPWLSTYVNAAIGVPADAEGGGDRAERILKAARELSDAREADDEAGQTARLVTALQLVAAEIGSLVTPTELLETLNARGYRWLKSPRSLAGLLAPLGLVARPACQGSRQGRASSRSRGAGAWPPR